MAKNVYTDLDHKQNYISNVAIKPAGLPASPVLGQIAFNSGDATLSVYNGAEWVPLDAR